MQGRIVPVLGLLTSLLIVARLGAVAQSLQFAREELTVVVSGSYCDVTAFYTFHNPTNSPMRQQLFYPLPAHQPFPDSLSVADLAAGTVVPYTVSTKGISFEIDCAPHTDRTYCIRFRQRTPQQSIEYILTTTRAWARPLEHARFVFVIPCEYALTASSFPPDRQTDQDGARTYTIEKREFMPDRDLTVRWKRRLP
jgi:hypothetical protein